MNLHNTNSDNRSSNISNPSSVFFQLFPITASPMPSKYQPSPSLLNQQLLPPSATMELQLSPSASHSEIGMDSHSSNNNNISSLEGSLNAPTMPIIDSRDNRCHAFEFFSPMDDATSMEQSYIPSHTSDTNFSGPPRTPHHGGSAANRHRNKRRNKKNKKTASITPTQPQP
jgi:hypothetical protein